MKLTFGKEFKTRQEISSLLGGDMQKGIAISHDYPVILLFTNEARLYEDYFYPSKRYDLIIVCIPVLVEVVIRIILIIICII